MNLLAIETSSDQMGVAVVDGSRVLASYELLADRPHAVELPQAVTRVLKASGLRLDQVDGLAVDIGPGSFTGLRIGVAFVKALVFQVRKPVAAVASLDVLAANVQYCPHLVCPLLDAKQRKVYAALYRPADGGLSKQSDYLLLPVDELMPMLQGPVLFLGDAAALYRQRLTERFGEQARFAPPELGWPRAASVGRLGLERLARGLTEDPRTLVPMYLYARDSSVRTPAVPLAPAPR